MLFLEIDVVDPSEFSDVLEVRGLTVGTHGHLFRYLVLGQGDTPPVVREIIRQHEPDPARRPGVHAGG